MQQYTLSIKEQIYELEITKAFQDEENDISYSIGASAVIKTFTYLQVCQVCVNNFLNVCVMQNPAIKWILNNNSSNMKYERMAVSNRLRLMLLIYYVWNP